MSDQEPILTNRQGHPVRDNQNTITVGNKGPATLENYNFIEKLAHFDRERVPERVVHARGASAHGFFEAYGTIGDEPASKYTRAKLFQAKGKQTPVFVRFSTVIHSKDSPETLRDPRGFAVKFYTEDGNWDLVGNNLRVFFIRDAIKFPDFIHSFKPDPVTNRQEPNRQFDFISQTPESIHMITLLFSPRGIPANYREQEGAGVNTYKLVNDKDEAVLVKFHWIPKQGVRSLTTPEAAEIQKEEFSHATKDLYDAIDAGNFPEWEFNVQIMADGEHPELDFDPLDDTKQWPESQFPLRKVGRLVLNKKPDNFFAESEQSAFGTGVKVDGIEFSADKMLQGRTFSYSDTQRYRVGPNYQQLPINAPKRDVRTNQRDGAMTRVQDAGGANPHVNYEPSILGGVVEAPNDVTEYRPHIEGSVGRYVEDRTGDDYKQAGEIYRAFDDRHRDDLIDNLVTNLKKADPKIQERMVWHFLHADEDYGKRVATGLGIDTETARKLPPLPNKPAPGTNRNATDNVPGVKSSGAPYAATAASGNGSSNGSGQAQNGNVAVMQRVFSTAEATGARR
jgi:catalase